MEVLRGIRLQICAGEFVAIVGASGSVKSTLIQLPTLELFAHRQEDPAMRVLLDMETGEVVARKGVGQLFSRRVRRVQSGKQAYSY